MVLSVLGPQPPISHYLFHGMSSLGGWLQHSRKGCIGKVLAITSPFDNISRGQLYRWRIGAERLADAS